MQGPAQGAGEVLARVRLHAKGESSAVAAVWGQPLGLGRRPGAHRPPRSAQRASLPRPTLCQEHKDIKTCAKEVKECDGLRNSYAACKRGQVDARSRLRGNKGY